MAPLIHLVSGPVGAGKTTLARALAEELGGVVFSIDEWMVALFGEDAPQPLEMAWLLPRVARCERQIWSLAAALGRRGVPAVLDLGFQGAAHRARYAALAAEAGLGVRLHALDVPLEERWRRVERRNASRSGGFALEVSRPMFDFMEGRWEPPTAEERSRIETAA